MRNTLRFKIVSAIILIIMVISMATISSAYSVGANLSSGDKLTGGKNVTVTLNLSNIDADTGITAITVDKISYDKNVFENVTESNFVGVNGWNPKYSSTSQVLTLTNNTHITANSSAITLTLKVKDGVTAKSSTIKFEGIVASAGLSTGDIDVGTKTITINAAAAADSGSENATPAPDSGSGNATPAPEDKTPVINLDSNKPNNITGAKKPNLPKAGLEVEIIFAVIAISFIGTFCYVKYKNIKKYDK